MVASVGEPTYNAGTDTLVVSDGFDSYANIAAMDDAAGGGPRLALIDADLTPFSLILGRTGSGKALRIAYTGDGVTQDSHNVESLNITAVPSNRTSYVSYYARVIIAAPGIGSNTLALKWMEHWYNDGTRNQFNTHDHCAFDCSTPQPTPGWHTYWQFWDTHGGDTAQQAMQPVRPNFNTEVADGQWHHFTHAFRENSVNGARDGFARMWIDGVQMMRVEQTAVNVTPTGSYAGDGYTVWCKQDDVDGITAGQSMVKLRFPSTETGDVVPTFTVDYDDLTWWQNNNT